MEIGHSPINMFISGNAEPLPSGGKQRHRKGGRLNQCATQRSTVSTDWDCDCPFDEPW